MADKMKTYDIWSEGYRIMCEYSDAHIMGKGQGNSFREACIQCFNSRPKDPEWAFNFNEEKLTFWGCKLFDNETDARKNFG